MYNFNQETKERLKKLGVSAVYLFGSEAENKSGKMSDIDIGVVFEKRNRTFGNRNKLYNELYEIFSNSFDLRNFKTIDIVFMQNASLELVFDIIKNGKILLDFNPNDRILFEHNIAMAYMDFNPLLKDFNKQILQRV